jgi:hypothetical protein
MRNLRGGLKVGLLVVGLLAVIATPAMAQFGDPLALAASGALVPFFGSGNNISVLEIAVPVKAELAPGMHTILYDAKCVRGESFPIPDTVNGLTLRVITGGDGLAAIAKDSGNGINLSPLEFSIHTRAYWINAVSPGQFRVLEPITIDNADSPLFDHVWNPMRSGATFFAGQEGTATSLKTTLYLICPGTAIHSANSQAAFSTLSGFPSILDFQTPPNTAFGGGTLRARVYRSAPGTSKHEEFLRDWQKPCDCLSTLALTNASTVYVTADTYTELETDGTFAGFTGYKGMKLPSIPAVDFFGRLSNGNRLTIRGDVFNPVTELGGCDLAGGCR